MKSHAGHRRRQMTTVNTLATTVFLLLITTTSLIVAAVKSPSSDHCDPTSQPAPQTLRSDQITVLINGYSESRIPLLKQISSIYSNSPLVASVIILWGNPETPSETLTHLSHNLSLPILQQPSPSLNNRFLPRPKLIATRAVLIADDDVLVDVKTIEFAFRVWGLNKDRLVGLFVRSHDVDLSTRAWMYTVHDHKYSIVLTKFMMMKVEYLYSYSCEGGEAMAEARRVVEEARNCEDILMNFVAAEAAGVGPVLVGAERVRDWGDPRNDGSRREGVREVGLSSRRGDHRKRRGECIREFHSRLGRMPLRYSYGKVVNSVGEQGLCDKGGKLVLCDKQV